MRSTLCLLALALAVAIPSCKASAPTLTNVSLAGPEDQSCDPVQNKKKCRVFGTPATGISGAWVIYVIAVLKGSAAPADHDAVAADGFMTALVGDTQINSDNNEWVLSNAVDQQKQYDVYYTTRKSVSGTEHKGDVIKVTTGSCGCPPPPTLTNVKLGKAACEPPNKKFCEVTFDVGISGGLEASVYAVTQNASVAAPQNYADFKAFEDVQPFPRVKVKFSASGAGTLIRNTTYGQDYKIYVAGKTKGGWLSSVTSLPACDCPKGPSPSPTPATLSSGDDEDSSGPFPVWAIVIIILVVLLICVVIVFIAMKKKKEDKKKKEEGDKAAGSGETGGVEMSA
eukprot:g3708.t1